MVEPLDFSKWVSENLGTYQYIQTWGVMYFVFEVNYFRFFISNLFVLLLISVT